MEPLYIRIDSRDNVAIIVNGGGLAAGAEFPCGLRLMEAVPQAHKVALRPLEAGEAVIRYGEVIG
ncbi:MAG: galactarate dehydratase, partial [Acidobacteria bacterium]|nr:galactarate dehydratase [Acidobacteriota bacterium]